ncbi:MAG: GNAT family N-acetyltransferase [Gammaproteobacteria bacterium]|nr:GNAT family N-acetyltransferase [Gammaproteobacteria bacterium]
MSAAADEGFQQGLPADLCLRGQFASLEPMSLEHEADLNAAAADGELYKLKVTRVPDLNEMPATIELALQEKQAGSKFPFVVRRLSDGRIVGSTSYYDIRPEHKNVAIGFTWYGKSAQRSAINTECKLLLLSHAFERLGCIAVAFHVDDTNTVSQAAVTRLGAKHDGVLRNHQLMPDGRIRHTYCYSITDAEWPAIKQRLMARLARG